MLRPANLLKKRLRHRCFLANFAKFSRAPFLWNTSGGCFCQIKTSNLILISQNSVTSQLNFHINIILILTINFNVNFVLIFFMTWIDMTAHNLFCCLNFIETTAELHFLRNSPQSLFFHVELPRLITLECGRKGSVGAWVVNNMAT